MAIEVTVKNPTRMFFENREEQNTGELALNGVYEALGLIIAISMEMESAELDEHIYQHFAKICGKI